MRRRGILRGDGRDRIRVLIRVLDLAHSAEFGSI
jgi:hypothetical protein